MGTHIVLTASPRARLISRLCLRPALWKFPAGITRHEKNLPAQQAAPQAYPRVSHSYGDQTRAPSARLPARKGSGTPLSLNPPPSAGFPLSARLRAPEEFSRVFKCGQRSNDTWFRVYSQPNQSAARLGMSVARAAVAGAVARNLIKRQIRASFQTRRAGLPAADIVVQARTAASRASKPELRASLEWHWQELIKRCAAH